MKNKLVFKSLTFLALAFFATSSIRASEVTGNLRSSGENSVNTIDTPSPKATTLDASTNTGGDGNIGSTGAATYNPLAGTSQSNLGARGTALEVNSGGQILGVETQESGSASGNDVVTQETNTSFFDEKPNQTAAAFSGFGSFEKNSSWFGIVLLVIFLIAITIYIHNRSLRKEKRGASDF